MIIIEKCSKFCVFKKMPIFAIQKKTIKTYNYDEKKQNLREKKLIIQKNERNKSKHRIIRYI